MMRVSVLSVLALVMLTSCGVSPEAAFEDVTGFEFVQSREDYSPFGRFRGDSLEFIGDMGPLLLERDDVELFEWRFQCAGGISSQVFVWSGSYINWWLDGPYWDLVWLDFNATDGEVVVRGEGDNATIGESIPEIPSDPENGIGSHRFAMAQASPSFSNYLEYGAFVVSSYQAGGDQIRVAVASGQQGDIDDPTHGLSEGEFTLDGFLADYEGPLMTRHVDCVVETWDVVQTVLPLEQR